MDIIEKKKKEFKKRFVRKDKKTGEYEMSWFLKETIQSKKMWQFIEEAIRETQKATRKEMEKELTVRKKEV